MCQCVSVCARARASFSLRHCDLLDIVGFVCVRERERVRARACMSAKSFACVRVSNNNNR